MIDNTLKLVCSVALLSFCGLDVCGVVFLQQINHSITQCICTNFTDPSAIDCVRYLHRTMYSNVCLKCGSLITPILYQFVVPMHCKSNTPVHTLINFLHPNSAF